MQLVEASRLKFVVCHRFEPDFDSVPAAKLIRIRLKIHSKSWKNTVLFNSLIYCGFCFLFFENPAYRMTESFNRILADAVKPQVNASGRKRTTNARADRNTGRS